MAGMDWIGIVWSGGFADWSGLERQEALGLGLDCSGRKWSGAERTGRNGIQTTSRKKE